MGNPFEINESSSYSRRSRYWS